MSLPTREELQAWVDNVAVRLGVNADVEEYAERWVLDNADRLLSDEIVRLYISPIIPASVVDRIINTFLYSGNYDITRVIADSNVIVLTVTLR